MLGAKANAPPSKKEGFARVTRCVDDRRRTAKLLSSFVVGQRRRRRSIFENRRSARRGARSRGPERFREAERDPASAPNAPNAFAQMMGAARASAGSSGKKTSPRASPKPSVAKTRVGNGGWRLALTAMATDPRRSGKWSGAFLRRRARRRAGRVPQVERTHLLVLARDTRLAEGPKVMRPRTRLVRRGGAAGRRRRRRRRIRETTTPNASGSAAVSTRRPRCARRTCTSCPATCAASG